jgi:histidyl-tRNA synthetase
LREEGFSTEIFLDNKVKIQKQFEYANAKNIRYALIIGEDEIQNNEMSIKNLFT